MLELFNESALAAGLYPGWDRERRQQLTLVAKAAWRFERDGTLLPTDPPPLVEADTHHGKPHESSLACARENMPFKQGGEVYLFGTAHPPRPGARAARVRLALHGPAGQHLDKTLLVLGRRRWQSRLLRHVPGEPEPLEPTPLRYENAFGGRLPGRVDSAWPLNPAGMGCNHSDWKLACPELPRIEWPNRLMRRPTDRLTPAGFGPLPVFWQPRLDEQGSPAEDAEFGACPWDDSAQPCLHNVAPHDQRFDAPFAGGERIELEGFFPDHAAPVRLELPPFPARARALVEGHPVPLKLVADTFVIDTDAQILALVARGGIRWALDDRRSGLILLEADASGTSVAHPEPQREGVA
ncbi:MAG: DUF2169 domain-containing protein [Gammaproteobacteria bacterium]|nr:MAG: DUF2169 domain-containing protein [Gammaproteobacteria bacterium]